MHRSSHNCKVGGGAAETAGGPLELASCTVYIAELLHNSLARETTENKNPILLTCKGFKPEETELILLVKEDDFSDPPVKQKQELCSSTLFIQGECLSS